MKLLQNNPNTFQTSDLYTFFNIEGDFELDGKSVKIENNYLKIENVEIIIVKQPNYIGGSFWLSSIAMILYLSGIQITTSSKVLELGAGIALPSLYLQSKHRECDITSTDKDVCVTSNSVKMNKYDINMRSLDWDDIDPEIGQYDFVIASDCVYRHNFESFVKTLQKVGHEKTKYVIFNAVREDSQEFVYLMQEAFPTVFVEFVTMNIGAYDVELLKMII